MTGRHRTRRRRITTRALDALIRAGILTGLVLLELIGLPAVGDLVDTATHR